MDTLIKIAALLTILLGLATLNCGTCCFTSCSSSGNGSEAVSSKRTIKTGLPAINSYTYEKGRQELIVEFTDGKSYLLEEVPEAVFHSLSKSESKDSFYEESIKGHFHSQRH